MFNICRGAQDGPRWCLPMCQTKSSVEAWLVALDEHVEHKDVPEGAKGAASGAVPDL